MDVNHSWCTDYLSPWTGLINTFGVHLLHHLNNISVWWHGLGTTAIVIAVLAKAPAHQSGRFVFQTFIDGTGGWAERASPAYVAVIGILMAQVSEFGTVGSTVTDQQYVVHGSIPSLVSI
jgi:hypothetical protein